MIEKAETEKPEFLGVIPLSRVEPIWKRSDRGHLFIRVHPDGAFDDLSLFISTGCYMESVTYKETGGVKLVYAHKLTPDGNISEGNPLELDPKSTICHVGYINSMEEQNAEFFKPLRNGF
jgi:hypothetical protein